MMIRTFLVVFGFICSLWIFAQSPEVQARAAFLKAQELYGNGDYSGAIDRLDNVKELLGSTNPRVEYLLCQSHFANKDAEKAEIALKKYFELADASDPNYNQMLLAIEEINARKEQDRKAKENAELAREKNLEEKHVYDQAVAGNKEEDFNRYLELYPEGKYKKEALIGYRQAVVARLLVEGHGDPKDYLTASSHYQEDNRDFKEALNWLNKYLEIGENAKQFWHVYTKAWLLLKLGDLKEAKNVAEQSLKLAEAYEKGDFGYIKKNKDLLAEIKRTR